ncbi:hypothetical protein [Arthrobacter sp. AL12]|uniref:hypothetical protein n=1 Tax=Arthrobacter sp. AL12 TaxID=3042241 RepID=UPI00249A31B2|nr:hypothetical protein [Arthrobacter sp. AL12]MDI3211636.1 hypothetical protein [Arthrobacter sp. AL12]
MSVRRRRRRLLLWSALPVLLALLLAAKLLSAAWFAGQAGGAFARGDAPAVESAAAVLGVANFLEPHKAPFAAGDARALRGDYAGARTAFEAALAAAPSADECRVRANLALSIERLGDAEADAGTGGGGADGTHGTDGAAGNGGTHGSGGTASAGEGLRLLEEALAVVRAAPAGCFDPDSAESADRADSEAEQRLQTAGQRLEEKIGRLRGLPGPGEAPGTQDPGAESAPEGEGGAPVEPLDAQLERLQNSGQSAQLERNRGLQREDYLNGTGAGPLTDRPW